MTVIEPAVQEPETAPFRPSSGTHGDFFRARFCDQCEKDRYESKRCGIFMRAMAYKIGDADYPKEWVIDKVAKWGEGNERCTAFVQRGSVRRPPRNKHARVRDKRQNGLPV